MWQLLRADADAGVGDADDDLSRGGVARAHSYDPTGGTEFVCIFNNVPKKLLQASGIAHDIMLLGLESEDDTHLFVAVVVAHNLGGLLEELVNVGSHCIVLLLAVVGTCEFKQVVDEWRLMLDIGA